MEGCPAGKRDQLAVAQAAVDRRALEREERA